MQLDLTDIIPEQKAVFQAFGVSDEVGVTDKTHGVITEAMELFAISAQPMGFREEISKKEFGIIFNGEGKNEEDTPLQHIFPHCDNIALFALTLGEDISDKINILFNENNFALGFMLDTVASLAAEKAVMVFERNYFKDLAKKQGENSNHIALCYSPGYCGWHISGQKKIFQYLHPEKIGISLNDSYLMSPLKSVTGSLIAGKKEIHMFKANYPFCRDCKDASCQDRMKRIFNS